MKYTGDQVLETMGEHAKNRNNAIYSLISKAFRFDVRGRRDKTILEFGAGKGEFIDRFTGINGLQTYALEIDPTYLEILKKRHTTFSSVGKMKIKVDYVFAIDVLEHIENDTGSLEELYRILDKNGMLLIYVPARPELYSKFDKSIGHYRRYLLSELREKAEQAGFSIESVYYHDFLGYFAAIFNKLTSRGGLNAKMVNLYDRIFFPISMMIESLFHPPFGKSIVLLAKKL